MADITSQVQYLLESGGINKAIYWGLKGFSDSQIMDKLEEEYPLIARASLYTLAAAGLAAIAAGSLASKSARDKSSLTVNPPVVSSNPIGRFEYTFRIIIPDSEGKIIRDPVVDRTYDHKLTDQEIAELLADLVDFFVKKYELEDVAVDPFGRIETIVEY